MTDVLSNLTGARTSSELLLTELSRQNWKLSVADPEIYKEGFNYEFNIKL